MDLLLWLAKFSFADLERDLNVFSKEELIERLKDRAHLAGMAIREMEDKTV